MTNVKKIPKTCSQISIHASFHEISIVLLETCSFCTRISADKQNVFHSRHCTRTATLSTRTSLGTELFLFIYELSFMSSFQVAVFERNWWINRHFGMLIYITYVLLWHFGRECRPNVVNPGGVGVFMYSNFTANQQVLYQPNHYL
jgi:hypothetical protein